MPHTRVWMVNDNSAVPVAAFSRGEQKARDIAAGQAPKASVPLVARSPAMRKLCDLAARIAPTDAAVLVRGEPGVGKELVARAIHRQSARADRPFRSLNCGAIREAEIESRLFGGHSSAVNASDRSGPGLLENANRQTLFLADLDRIPLWAQSHLSEILHRRSLRPETSCDRAPLDVRVIASTSCDLETAVATGRFDGGLYYFLSPVVLHVPPLRERRQEITFLAEWYLAETLTRQGIDAAIGSHRFSPEAWECLLNHDWPGNLPELAGTVARAVALAGGTEIGREAIVLGRHRANLQTAETIAVPLGGSFIEIERQIVAAVIERCGGNKAAAARALGLHRRTLYRMLEA